MLIKINSEAPKFKCNACGSCCSHIRGIVPKEDMEFLKEHVFGEMPVVQLVPVEQMTFPLWDWEAKRFMEWQHEADVDANIKPLRAIFDLNSNRAIILTYFMDSEKDSCPFLKQSETQVVSGARKNKAFLGNNKCSIYHTKRAYVCRLFPFNRGPFAGKEEMKLKDGIFGECGAMEHILPQVPDDFKKMIKFLNDAFPDGSFINAVQNDIVIGWANRTIVDLIRKNIIKPAVNYPYAFLLKRIENAEKIDFTDFLAESGYLTEREKDELIKGFDSNIGAEEKISHFLENSR